MPGRSKQDRTDKPVRGRYARAARNEVDQGAAISGPAGADGTLPGDPLADPQGRAALGARAREFARSHHGRWQTRAAGRERAHRRPGLRPTSRRVKTRDDRLCGIRARMSESTRSRTALGRHRVWAALAEQKLSRIRLAGDDIAVLLEHLGSSAVPGLDASPTIALQLSLTKFTPQERHGTPLESLGHLVVPATESSGHRSFAETPQPPRTHHPRACQTQTEDKVRKVSGRDSRRSHSDEARH